MHQLLAQAHERLTDGLKSSSLDTCYRWSCARRWMPANNGKPPGWFSAEDYPWVPEILNSRAPLNWVMKGAQLGLTECGINRAFFEVDHMGEDVMYLMPTDKSAMLFSKTRLANAIKMSPYLLNRVTDPLEVKQVGLASFYVRGANGDINVKSTPVGRLILDEISEMEERQLWLALQRLAGHSDKLVWGMSTPKFPNRDIHKLFLASTQEHFFFNCPHCKKKIELIWPDSFCLRGCSPDDPEVHQSFIKCYLCQDILPHHEKRKWLAGGWWEPTAVDADPATRGFWLNQMYSSTVSPGEFAISNLRGIGDEDARREFHNSCLGLPYVEDGAQVSDAHIDLCIKKYSMNAELPKIGDKAIYTLGVDQGGFHHWWVDKWELDLKGIGDMNDRGHARMIACGRIFQDDWDQIYNLMRMFQVKMAVIDFFPDPTNARKFARRFPGFVWLCQYVVGRGARELTRYEDEFGANVVKVDKASWMSKSLGRIMTKQQDLPLDLPMECRRQLKNQIRSYKKGVDGNYQAEYVKAGDDHYGHGRNYSEIALRLLDPTLSPDDIIRSTRG